MFKTPSIRVFVAAIAVLPAILLAVVLVSLLTVSSREISERLGTSLMDGATAQIRTDVSSFLSNAVRVSDLYQRRVSSGQLPTAGLNAWERQELDDLAVNSAVASVSFGSVDGETTWILRHAGRLELGRVTTGGEAREYVIDEKTGAVDPTPIRSYQYDPRERPWYKTATAAGTPVWTPVYFWFGSGGADSETGTGYTRSIRDHDGNLLGVLVIDVTLGGISTFLKTLPLAQHGTVFIVDQEDLLVAASHGAVNSEKGERLLLAGSDQVAARAVATAFASSTIRRSGESTEELVIDGKPSRVRVTPLRPFPGIDWTIVAVVPESAFLADAAAVQNRATWLSVVAAIGGLAIALILSSRLSRPLLALASHVRRVGEGDFESRLHLRAARELHDLSEELNRMAGDLKDRMELQQSLEVAMQVQQSLLPTGPPKVAGLDVAGHSKYCDETGGDYYDFIEVADLPGGRLLIAVGDVMGHGIAAALLMATARAALRAHAAHADSLGVLMNEVNAVLARDARHGRFMTMILVVVDPNLGTIRWSSAGHDPPIVWDAANAEFRDVQGGDVPLGVMEDSVYEEYRVEKISPRSIIVIGTDGIWEAMNAAGDMFGKDRLNDIVRGAGELTAKEIVSTIERDLAAFCTPLKYADDVTMVVIKLQQPA